MCESTGVRWLEHRQGERERADRWRRIGLSLPGQYEYENYHWPSNSIWKHDGDGIVAWPLTFERLIVILRKAVVQVNEMVPVENRTIRLDELRVHQQ